MEQKIEYTLEKKEHLKNEIKRLIKESGLSDNNFAKDMLGFTNGSKLNHVLNRWNEKGVVGNATWQTIERYINFSQRFKGIYKYVATKNVIDICKACETAYQIKVNYPVIGNCGKSKTTGLTLYKNEIEKQNRFRVIYFNAQFCETAKQFICGLLDAAGCPKVGTIANQFLHLRESLKNEDCLVLIDEISALKASNIVVVKLLTSALKDICGTVLAGTQYFWDTIDKGVEKDKHLFRECKDRLYKYPLHLNNHTTKEEAEKILEANGITGVYLEFALGTCKYEDYTEEEAEILKKYCWTNAEESLRGVEHSIKALQWAQSGNLKIPFQLGQII